MLTLKEFKHRPMGKKKRKSVFKVILIKVFSVIIVLNLVLSGIFIEQTVSLMRDNQETRIASLRNEVIGLFNYTTATMPHLEDVYMLYYKEAYDKLNELASINKVEEDSLNFNPLYYNIEVILNNKIVNATDRSKIGTERIIDTLNSEEECLMKDFLMDTKQKRLRVDKYQFCGGNKYIFGVSVYTKIGDEMMLLFRNRLDSLRTINDDIESVNVYLKDENILGLLENESDLPLMDSLLPKAFNEKIDIHEHFTQNKRHYVGHLLYLHADETNFTEKEIVISVVNDVTGFGIPVRNTILKQTILTLIIFVLLIGIILMATRDYRLMLRDILIKTRLISNGNFSERVIEKGNNEFTTLAERFNQMVQKLEFSYNDLNEKNKLINERNEELSQQNEEIAAQRDEIEAQRDEIETQRNFAIDQKEIIEKQKNEMLDSITYAQRIQAATLPHEQYINEIIPDNFVLFKPRDIVSGDFYWIKQVDEYIIIVAADCTGHGVPGSIMSILGVSLLNEIVHHKKIVQPNLILNEMRKQIKRSLRQSGKKNEAKDGMDMALCSVNTNTNIMQYAGAFNPLIIVRDSEIIEYKGDRMPVGIHIKEKPTFTNHEIQLEPGDTMYVFSDGFADQLGGKECKKFMMKNLKNLFVEIHENALFEQKEKLESKLTDWMGEETQLDDILIVGFRII